MFDRLRRWVGRRVVEIGSGIGNLSAFLLDSERLVLTDTREEYLERLRTRFANTPMLRSRASIYRPSLARSPGNNSTPSSVSTCSNTWTTTFLAPGDASDAGARRPPDPARARAPRVVWDDG